MSRLPAGAAPACDYIVVGGGSAGCAVAARLSERANVAVLLLEAGPAPTSPWLHVPGGFFKTIADPRYDWCYETDPEPNLNGRRLAWPRGKVLGGSSAINGLVYIRGQAADYDRWAQLGNRGWSYEDVLPYFKRAESQQRGADGYHGADGPLPCRTHASATRSSIVSVAAGEQAGLPQRRLQWRGAGGRGLLPVHRP